MQDNNIIQEAIDCLKRLHKENAKFKADIKELSSIIVCKNGTIATLAKTRDNLKAENERLKFKLDTVEADYEASEIEIEDLKNELNFQTTANNHLLKLYEYGQKEVATYKQLADKYLGCLQEIKEIAKAPSPYINNLEIKSATEVGYDYAAICNELEKRLHKVLELITKAESEG